MPTGMVKSRLKEIFPPGFDTASSRAGNAGSHYKLKLEQLYYSLVERYDCNMRVRSLVVKSAWYCKQTRSSEHEFILIQVEDKAIEGLSNFLVVDRNFGEPSHRPLGIISRSWVSFQTKSTVDTFRVSYDGNMKQLIEECQLNPYEHVEQLHFHSETPLHLYELVTLACIVSGRYPVQPTFDPGCCIFVGLVWDFMRRMRPSAACSNALAKKRGRFIWVPSPPSTSQTEAVYESVQEQLTLVEIEFKSQRAVCLIRQPALYCPDPYLRDGVEESGGKRNKPR